MSPWDEAIAIAAAAVGVSGGLWLALSGCWALLLLVVAGGALLLDTGRRR